MPVRSILCPVELNEESYIALATAGALAQSMRAVLYVMHVAPSPSTQDDMDSKQRKEVIQHAIDRHVGAEVQTSVMFVEGNPLDEIIDKAHHVEADLIVMTATSGGERKSDRGTVLEEEVAQSVACPVYALRVSEITSQRSIPFDYFVRQFICLN